jgi:ABC-type Zn2+ transport system substrate-binding protein/surface adhesin
MSTRTMKMLGVGIAAIAFLLVTIPVLKSSVAYADSGDHNKDHRDDGDHDHGHDRDHNKGHRDNHNDRDHDRDKK